MPDPINVADDKYKNFLKLYRDFSSSNLPVSIEPLPPSGSSREYVRIADQQSSILGMYNPNPRENRAFEYLTGEFKNYNLNVPEILARYRDQYYLLEDLGNTTLFDYICQHQFNDRIVNYLEKCCNQLLEFQITAGLNLNYSHCYPHSQFDRNSMIMDLNYFKYYFLKVKKRNLDENRLENDFNIFTEYLGQVPGKFFMYRDFQSRNIMIKDNQLFFIDYQGGRRGPLQYDLGSFLYQARAEIPEQIRLRMLNYYLSRLECFENGDLTNFIDHYYEFVVLRILQTLGAYGFRGLIQKKTHFIKSIPLALKNLDQVLPKTMIPDRCTYLSLLLKQLIESQRPSDDYKEKKLKLTIFSFAYPAGIPNDEQGHGGGFVFDCRCLENPGKITEYINLTGKSEPVQKFFRNRPEIMTWLNAVFDIIDQAVNTYQHRGFNSLTVCFGCTGGRHRSVFCAEQLKKHLKEKFNIQIKLIHTAIGKP